VERDALDLTLRAVLDEQHPSASDASVRVFASEFRRGTDEIVVGLNSDNPRIRCTAIKVTTELLLRLLPLRSAINMS
jgi:hypothetical protein